MQLAFLTVIYKGGCGSLCAFAGLRGGHSHNCANDCGRLAGQAACVKQASQRGGGESKLHRTWWFGRHGEDESIAEFDRTLVPLAIVSVTNTHRRFELTDLANEILCEGRGEENKSWHVLLGGAGGGAHDQALSGMLWDIWEKDVVCAADVSVVPRMVESKWTRQVEVGLGVENTKELDVGSVTASIQKVHSRCDDKMVNFWVVLNECETHGLHSVIDVVDAACGGPTLEHDDVQRIPVSVVVAVPAMKQLKPPPLEHERGHPTQR